MFHALQQSLEVYFWSTLYIFFIHIYRICIITLFKKVEQIKYQTENTLKRNQLERYKSKQI